MLFRKISVNDPVAWDDRTSVKYLSEILRFIRLSEYTLDYTSLLFSKIWYILKIWFLHFFFKSLKISSKSYIIYFEDLYVSRIFDFTFWLIAFYFNLLISRFFRLQVLVKITIFIFTIRSSINIIFKNYYFMLISYLTRCEIKGKLYVDICGILYFTWLLFDTWLFFDIKN